MTSPVLAPDVMQLINAHKGIWLDIGCGPHKSAGAIGMDKRALPGIDIVHNLLEMPWPLPDACCRRILASHIIEHLPPDRIWEIMDECWRVMLPEGQLIITMPYGTNARALQDPSHYRCWIEACPQYFDPVFPLYTVTYPKPWKIGHNQQGELNLWWAADGDITVIFDKRTLEDAATCAYYAPPVTEDARNGHRPRTD